VPRVVALIRARARAIASALTRAKLVFTSASINPSSLLKIVALFFSISTGEESSQPTKYANKIITSIFLVYEDHNP